MSLISREDAIKELMSWLPKLERGLIHWTGVKAMLENLPDEEDRWIPCSERLPKHGEDVLVTRKYDGREDDTRYVEVASCYGEDDDIIWTSFSDEYKIHPKNHHVIAWRPLPKPYQTKEKKHDND